MNVRGTPLTLVLPLLFAPFACSVLAEGELAGKPLANAGGGASTGPGGNGPGGNDGGGGASPCNDTCSASEACCAETCVNLETSAEHCGGCGQACAAGERCCGGEVGCAACCAHADCS